MNNPYQFYLVTDRGNIKNNNLTDVVMTAVRSGVTCIQLREKNCSTLEYIELARELKQKLQSCSIPLFINDRVDVALAANVDGIHLGNNDMSYVDACRILPKDIKIALTITNLTDIDKFNHYQLAYLGVSSLFQSKTKSDIEHFWSEDDIFKLKQKSRHLLIGIGGIELSNINQVLTYGLDGIALSSAICTQPSLQLVARQTKCFAKLIAM